MKISRIIFKQEQPGGGTLYRAECTDVFNNWKEQYKSSCVADVEAEENPVVYIQGVLQDGKCVRRKIDGTIIADTKRVLVFSKAPDGLFSFMTLPDWKLQLQQLILKTSVIMQMKVYLTLN